jgi:hypothetical protein
MRALALIPVLLLAACGGKAPVADELAAERAALQREVTLLTGSHYVADFNEFSAAAFPGAHGNPEYLAVPASGTHAEMGRVSHVLDPRQTFIQPAVLEQFLADTTRLMYMAEGLAGYDWVGPEDHPGWTGADWEKRQPVLVLLRRVWALVALERQTEAEEQIEGVYRLVATFHGAGSNETAAAIGRLHTELDPWAAWVIRHSEDPDALVSRLDAARPRGLSVYHYLSGEAVAAVRAAQVVLDGGQADWHHDYADRAETMRAMAAYLGALRVMLADAQKCSSLLGADCAGTFVVEPYGGLEAPEPELQRLAHVLRTAYLLELQPMVRRVRLRLYAMETRHESWEAIEQAMRETAPIPSLLNARWHPDRLVLQELPDHPMYTLAPKGQTYETELTHRQ